MTIDVTVHEQQETVLDGKGQPLREGMMVRTIDQLAGAELEKYVKELPAALELGKKVYEFYLDNGGVPTLSQLLYLMYTDTEELEDEGLATDGLLLYCAKNRYQLPIDYYSATVSARLTILCLCMQMQSE